MDVLLKTLNPDMPDFRARQSIIQDLDTTFLVEAGAGTGKTTSMVARMVSLIASGRCKSVNNIAAVTFTRKAAGELRARFRVRLEQCAADPGVAAAERDRLRAAVAHSDGCFIGTIHSFCARLLRERPIEAGVDIGFTELDEVLDKEMREEAWRSFVVRMHATGSPLLVRLEALGMELEELRDVFLRFANYPDVTKWPCPPVVEPEAKPVAQKVIEFCESIERLAREHPFPIDRGTDELMDRYEFIMRQVALADGFESDPSELYDLLGVFKKAKPTQKIWASKDLAKDENARYEAFRANVVEPFCCAWLEYRYPAVMDVLKAAQTSYDECKAHAGVLNFQDLLLKSASLMRGKPHIRNYFRAQYTHLLVDEFQDTDPVQAELMLLMTADDPTEDNWTRCRPVPGSLFVVGDPKQSIYRFRRADIVTYNQVKDIIREVGDCLALTVNFRTTSNILDWTNATCSNWFPSIASPTMPEYVPLHAGRGDAHPKAELCGLYHIRFDHKGLLKDGCIQREAETIASCIHASIAQGKLVDHPKREPAPAQPGDFMIVTQKKAHLTVFARALETLGIPHQVAGGQALNEIRELRLLQDFLYAALHPDDSIRLVAVLRGGLSGLSDPELQMLRSAKGRFDYRKPLPASLPLDTGARYTVLFDMLRATADDFHHYPPVTAVERAAARTGLDAWTATAPDGLTRAGGFRKALELVRANQNSAWSPEALLEFMAKLISRESEQDSMSVCERNDSAVRLMNLHKVKGLEAPVVFLAGGAGKSPHPPSLHIDRSAHGDTPGYLWVTRKVPGGHGRSEPLAQPPNWEQYRTRETEFDEMEKKRLLYVGATRAGSCLCITLANESKNPWSDFDEYAKGEEFNPLPAFHAETVAEEDPARDDLRSSDPLESMEGPAANLDTLRMPTYRFQAAKKFALESGEPEDRPTAPKGNAPARLALGTQWGTIAHGLLEAAMLNEKVDLVDLAQARLLEMGLPPEYAAEIAAHVHSVMESDTWLRARNALECHVEAPFLTLFDDEADDHKNVDILMRGVVDLVFKESDGWVIVDYKTDDREDRNLAQLKEVYRPQLELYAKIWEEAAGEAVKEIGLHFVRTNQYTRLN